MSHTESHLEPIGNSQKNDLSEPDQKLRHAIRDKLLGHGSIQSSDIQVDVQGGEVTLEGTVPEETMKRYTEDLINEIPDVKKINNHLRFKETDITRDPLPH